MANFFEKIFDFFNNSKNEESASNVDTQDLEDLIDASWSGYSTK